MNPMTAEIREGKRLHLLAMLEKHHCRLQTATEARQRRQALIRRIKDCAEDGAVAMVWSGRDCDGVRYTGSVYVVDASIKEVDREAAHTYKWADGPCSFYIERPSVAREIKRTSRDLTLEAFEDGHPHVIYD